MADDMNSSIDNIDDDIDEIDDQDDDLLLQLTPRLPVSTFTDYDPTVPPENGADYLRRVQLETMREPRIKTDFDLLRSLRPNNSIYEDLREHRFIKSPQSLIIDNDSRLINDIIDSFERLRATIDDHRLRNQSNGPLTKSQRLALIKRVKNPGTNLPNLSLLAQLSPTEILKLLRYHQEWLMAEGHDLSNLSLDQLNSRCIWLYSLLSLMDPIQTDSIQSMLRDISRVCSQIRQRLYKSLIDSTNDSNDSNGTIDLNGPNAPIDELINQISSLSLIIIIIGRYYRQYDLLDSFES